MAITVEGATIKATASNGIPMVEGSKNLIKINITNPINMNLDTFKNNLQPYLTGDNNAVIQSNGVSSSDCDIDFISREHGIIMGIYYAEPLLDYSSHISQQNLKLTSDDFFKPEFDSLGFQSANVYGIADTDFADEYFNKVKSSTFGYLPRYYEYKLPQDVVDESASLAFPQWLIPARFREIFKDAFNNPYLRVNYRSFKIRPSLLNPIFGVQVSETSGVESFRLLACFSNNCVAIRPMSESGMPY